MCLMHKCNLPALVVLAKVALLPCPQAVIHFCHSKTAVPFRNFRQTLPIPFLTPFPTMCCAHQMNQSSETWKAFSSWIQSWCVQNTLLEGSLQCRSRRICHTGDLHTQGFFVEFQELLATLDSSQKPETFPLPFTQICPISTSCQPATLLLCFPPCNKA